MSLGVYPIIIQRIIDETKSKNLLALKDFFFLLNDSQVALESQGI
jgi:hypothetical protein